MKVGTFICEICDKQFNRFICRTKNRNHSFCSQICYRQWRNNFWIMSEQMKINIGKGNKGRIFPKESKDKISKSRLGIEPWNKNKTNVYSEENLKLRSEIAKKQIITDTQKQKISTTLREKYKSGELSTWKNGVPPVTPLALLIRHSFEYTNWIKQVFKRDDYTCKKCGERGCYLEAHHLKPFAQILKEFLNQYNQFSPIEDKEALIRLSKTHESFWNINNGRTLCIKCHDQIGVKSCV